MKGNNIYDIIGKYLADDIDDKEKEFFESWLNQCEENSNEFNLHKKVWEEMQIRFLPEDSESVFKNILNGIDDQQELDLQEKQKITSSKGRQRFIIGAKIAATLLLFVTALYVFKTFVNDRTHVATIINTVEKQNIAGQKSKIFLPDGSVVWLNAESKITFPEKFSDEKREINLTGEAFFKVIKNPDQPFIVKSGSISTTVLGTSFNVRAFENESNVFVALKNGKVRVEALEKENFPAMFLEPGEAVKYNKSEGTAKKEEFDQELLLAWKDGIIVFKDAGLDEIINTLSRWYGVQFEVKNKSNEKWEYTGSFDNENLSNVLDGISFSHDFKYIIDQKNVIIKLN